MRIAIINSVCSSGSTGRISEAIASKAIASGQDATVFYGLGNSAFFKAVKISNRFDYVLHNVLSRLFDCEGLASSIGTLKLIRRLRQYSPDIIHIHNLHGHYINYRLLFKYIGKESRCLVIMTLHDCWSFTGHCAHFDIHNCDGWQVGCQSCPYRRSYPMAYFSRSSRNYKLKQTLIASLGERLHIVPVSNWMDSFLPKSMFRDIRHTVIHNGIDLSVFKYSTANTVRKRNNITKEYVLGVANPWSSYKGLDDFVRLRTHLDKSILIVLVGLSQEQIETMPTGIVGLESTKCLSELVELYSSALALVNTTYCDNYPTVNLESIACGTPVITYDTGGSPEAVSQQTGSVIHKGNISGLVDAIYDYLKRDREELRRSCIEYAKTHFDQNKCFESYIRLYSMQ